MCGRFAAFSPAEKIHTHFGIPKILPPEQAEPNYNIAPTQKIAAVVQETDDRFLRIVNWGLVPFWAKDLSIGSRLINARSETAAEKPAFRAAFRNRRCLIVNDGFYEWKGPKGDKQPFFVRPKGVDGPFAFAGLWETWRPENEKNTEPFVSATILKAEASASMASIHHRMPVILTPEAYSDWLSPINTTPAELIRIIREQSYLEFEARPVSKEVNRPGSNHPSLIDKI